MDERSIALRSAGVAAASPKHLRAMLDSAVEYAIIGLTVEGLVSTWSRGAELVLGWAESEVLGRDAAFIFTPEDRAAGAHEEEKATARKCGRAADERWHLKKDGSRFWASGILMLLKSDGGGYVKILRDLTAAKCAQDELQSALSRADALSAEQLSQAQVLKTLIETGVRIASELDLEKLLQTVTDAGVELTGAQFGAFFYSVVDESGGKLMLYTLSGAERSQFEHFGMPRATQIFAPTFRGDGVIRSDDILGDPRYGKNAPHRGMPEGHLPVRSYLAVPVSSRTGEVIGGLFFGHGQTAIFSKAHEDLATGIAAQAAIAIDNARLFQATKKLNETLEARVTERTAERDRIWRLSTDIMLVARFDGSIEAVNPAWTAMLGWEQAETIGRRFFEFVYPEDLDATMREARSLAQGRRTDRFENRYRSKDGEYRWISWIAVPEGEHIHAIGRDVSAEKSAQAELELAQDQLRQAQKMEAVGQLTGGIAHDFNNMLAVVIGSLDLLERRIGADLRARRYIDAASDGAKRAALLTQRLLAFSRQQPLKPEPTDANKLIAGMSELIRRSLGSEIRLETVLAGGLWRTFVDPNQLESAILNLAVNARDAMPGGGGSQLKLRTRTSTSAMHLRKWELQSGSTCLLR